MAMVPAPAKPFSTSFITVAVLATSLSEKSLIWKIGPTMLASWVGSSAEGLADTLAVLTARTYEQRTWFLRAASCAALYCGPFGTLGAYSCVPSAPLNAAVPPPPPLYRPVPPLMRVCVSSTSTASGSCLPPGGIGTSEVASEGWLIVVGCSAGLMSSIGAIELPPETLESVPMSVSSCPLRPAMAMPYIGLWGFDCVSFCDMAQITAPLTAAAVAAVILVMMPRLMAPSACHRSPSEASMLALELGTMLPGTPSLP